MPAISVVMSAYNAEKYLQESVESILNQSFADFEFLITDDCSTDNTLIMLKEYASKDSRIKLMSNSENIGLTKSLNRMIDVSRGDFIARFDADDVSCEQRFQKQIEYMRKHPEIGVCATNVEKLNGSIKKKNTRNFFEHEEIKAALLFNNVIPHTAVMIRSKLFKEHGFRYNEEYKIIQDYELWQRLVKYTRFHILKDVLAMFRILDSGVSGQSSKKPNYRERVLQNIYIAVLGDLEIIPSEAEINSHIMVAGNRINHSLDTLLLCEEWLLKLLAANNKICSYDNEAFRNIIHNCWLGLCLRSTSIGLKVFSSYYKSRLFNYNHISIRAILKLFIKCLKKHDAGPDCYNNSVNHTSL